jgi:CspA family cold shock protein
MATGTIKKLFADRGFGFIRMEDGQNIFFQRNELQGAADESLVECQKVEFEVERTDKGLNAKNIRLAEETS